MIEAIFKNPGNFFEHKNGVFMIVEFFENPAEYIIYKQQKGEI